MSKPVKSTLTLSEDHLIESAKYGHFKRMFDTTSKDFVLWMKVRVEYPDIIINELKVLLPFPLSYLCIEVFSRVKVTEKNYFRVE